MPTKSAPSPARRAARHCEPGACRPAAISTSRGWPVISLLWPVCGLSELLLFYIHYISIHSGTAKMFGLYLIASIICQDNLIQFNTILYHFILYPFGLPESLHPQPLYVGRHPHADRRGLQPASADALSGGKGLPPYELCLAPKDCRPTSFVWRQRVTALLYDRLTPDSRLTRGL